MDFDPDRNRRKSSHCCIRENVVLRRLFHWSFIHPASYSFYVGMAALWLAFYVGFSAWFAHQSAGFSTSANQSIEQALTMLVVHAIAVLCCGTGCYIERLVPLRIVLTVVMVLHLKGIALFSGLILIKYTTGMTALSFFIPLGGLLKILGWLILSGGWVWFAFTQQGKH